MGQGVCLMFRVGARGRLQGLADPLLPAIRTGPLCTDPGSKQIRSGDRSHVREESSEHLPWGLCVSLAEPRGAQICGQIFSGFVCRGVATAGRAQLSQALAAEAVTVEAVTVEAVRQTGGGGEDCAEKSPGARGGRIKERALSL